MLAYYEKGLDFWRYLQQKWVNLPPEHPRFAERAGALGEIERHLEHVFFFASMNMFRPQPPPRDPYAMRLEGRSHIPRNLYL